MSLLKQIDDKGAVIEWSPLYTHSNMVALGTKVSNRHTIIIHMICMCVLGLSGLWF